MSNNPKILVEFTELEVKYLADILHERYFALSAMKANWSDSEKHVNRAEQEQKIIIEIKDMMLKNASEQGFGEL